MSGKINIWWAGNTKVFNYGDALAPYLVRKLSGKEPVLTPINSGKKVYLVIGSVINPHWTSKYCEVWGCGIIDSSHTAKPGVKFHSVRGPLTRAKLLKTGHECPEIYGDPALLLPSLYQPKTNKNYKIGVIPHYIDYKIVTPRIKDDDIKIIDLMHPNVEDITDEIFSCDRIISSSLHGVIVAQAYGIPAIWVKFGNRLAGDDIKFKDYFLSVGIKPYTGVDLSKLNDFNIDNLIKLVDDSEETLIKNFDYDKLLNSCPFKKK